jgi:hypothetical protein
LAPHEAVRRHVSQFFKTKVSSDINTYMTIAQLGSITFDCDDPSTLAAFWAELIGGEIGFTSDDFVAVKTDRA